MAQKNNIFDEVFNRLLGLGIQSQKGLAGILGISSATVWKAKNENRFPKKWVSILCQIYNKSPGWFFGEQDAALPQLEISLVKSLMEDILELKNQLNYMEGTIRLLRGEVDALKAHKDIPLPKTKKKEQHYSNQQEKESLAVAF